MRTPARNQRTLAVCIGNTTLFCGIFVGTRRRLSWRLPHASMALLPKRMDGAVDRAVICSVVPKLTAPLGALIAKHWTVRPHVLTAGSPHGLTLGYRRPHELGTDRLAAAVGARAAFPNQNIVIVDCGTATTVTALRSDGTLLGGAILPGLALWPEMLAARTAQLPSVPLVRPQKAIGRSPREGIASGVFFGHCGSIRHVVARVRSEAFGRRSSVVLATGGHARLLRAEAQFDVISPDLVLAGLIHVAREVSSHA